LATRGLPQRAGEPGLAESGGASDEQVVAGADPVAAGESRDLSCVEPARAAAVDILDAGVGVFELGLLQQALEAARIAPGEFAIN